MVAANQSDFLNEGAIDPFTGLAPAQTEDEIAAQRRAQLQRSATNTSNINQAPGGYLDQRSANQDNFTAAAPDDWKDYLLAGGILAAPAAVMGAGALIGGAGALGFGAGTGSIQAANAGLAASESAAASAPGVVGYGATSAPFMMASPSAAGAAPGVAGAAGTAAAGGMPWGDIAKTAIGVAGPTVINEVLGGRTKEQDALIAKQGQLAKEAQIRQGQQQDARMNALGQQMLAFNPTNQMMAQMFGPGAAFQPEQVASMVQGQAPPQLDPSLIDYRGTDPAQRAKVDEWIRRQKEFEAAESGRRDMVMGGMSPVGPGPAPVQMPQVQAARRF